MSKASATTPGERVYEIPDRAIQNSSQRFALYSCLGLIWTYTQTSPIMQSLHTGLLILVIGVPLLSLFCRQETRVLVGEQRFLLSRRFFGMTWKEISLPFAEVEEVSILGEPISGKPYLFHRATGRLIRAVCNDGPIYPLARPDTPQATLELAEELGRLLDRPAVDNSFTARADTALGLAKKPAGFSSEVKLVGTTLRVALDAKAKQRGDLFMFAGIILVFGFFFGYLTLYQRQLTPKILDNVMLVAVIVSVLALPFVSRRYAAPETLIASWQGLQFDLPGRWIQGKLGPADEIRVEVQEQKGVPGLLVADESHELFVGRGLALQELHWIREALRKALDDQIPF